MPWRVFLGSMLTMLSLFIAFLLNYTILGEPYHTDISRSPFGREALHPTATLLSLALFVFALALVFTGLQKMETK